MRPHIVTFVIVALAAGAIAPAAAAGDAERGRTIFNRCSACHALDGTNGRGPPLDGVVGRKAGSVPGFRFSRAMVTFGEFWDAHALDAYLAAPNRLVRGTSMTTRLRNARDRADVIAFLKTVPSR